LSNYRSGQTSSSTVMIGVIVFGLMACGIYAWRFKKDSPTVEPTPPPQVRPIETVNPHPETPAAQPPAPQPDAPVSASPQQAAPGASSGTWANRPLSLPKQAPAEPPVIQAGGGTELMRQALEAQRRGDLITARNALSRALDQGLSLEDADAAQKELGRLADAMLFSSATSVSDPLIGFHEVASGESVHSIAATHHVSEGLLAKINNIDRPSMLRAGERIKIINGPFWARVDKSDHRMDVFLGDVMVRSYLVGLGAEGGTPLGTWVVRDKLRDPDWTDPNTNRHYESSDPANPIGERWIALEGIEGDAVGKSGFGIHGTIDPQSIGKDMSMGCIRMNGEDVEFVFDLLVIKDSKVVVKP
jgi:lipoprotein-anchoring transpeptidase ErfK/SrfK